MATPSTELQLPPTNTGLTQVMQLVPSGPQLGLVLALAAAVTLAVGVLLWASRPSMVPLNPSLGASSNRQLIEQLNGLGQEYEVSASGMVLVPQEDMTNLKIRLGGEFFPDSDSGLNDAASSGGGLFDKSQEERRQQRIRQLERELVKTISQLQNVATARVHLAIPRRSVFIRDIRARPSASVKLEVSAGRILDAGQIAGIANLVATSVPHLEPSQVSIVDQHGKLLNRDLNDPMAQITNRQLAYKQHFEMMAAAKVEHLLDASVGSGGYRVQVDASFDFSRVQEEQTTYEQDPKAVRSMQEMVQRSMSGDAAIGTPGALTNQPPEGGSVDGGDGENGAAADAGQGNFRRELTRNMEVGESRTKTTRAPWRLERVSVALLVDDKVSVDEAGEATRTPREQKELDAIQSLIKTAIGFKEERGDSVTVINQSFLPAEQLEPAPEPELWEQSWFEPVLKTSLSGIALALLVLMVIRPTARALIGRHKTPDKATGDDAESSDESGGDGEQALLESDRLSLSASSGELLEPPARVHGDILNLAREMANQDPQRVATVLKKWMDNDE